MKRDPKRIAPQSSRHTPCALRNAARGEPATARPLGTNWRPILPLFVSAFLVATGSVRGAPPVDGQGRPLIRKLGTVDVDKVENSPVVFRGKLYRRRSAE